MVQREEGTRGKTEAERESYTRKRKEKEERREQEKTEAIESLATVLSTLLLDSTSMSTTGVSCAARIIISTF